jgi:hypothetical protein
MGAHCQSLQPKSRSPTLPRVRAGRFTPKYTGVIVLMLTALFCESAHRSLLREDSDSDLRGVPKKLSQI